MKESRFVFTLAVIVLCVSLVSSEMELGLEDYNIRVDPTPTTKHSVRGGPIEHGSPLNPYIPKLPPPPPPQPQDAH
ncbi:hypothetical protein BRARA_J02914 [Brassica rapa]|uniref:BnaA10g27460D protein n=3 Tax=Brassica TaxID=3705 RepID=A0A078HR55_BRANA|nr:hypothetical protein IGI04_042128 [Brassica rapa subsp. trilocularis]RID43080.1 hypothetical protein BRARA_J02914 [Brassica rapa]CDY40322.1 BnaA10g27460D [Brassica napus]